MELEGPVCHVFHSGVAKHSINLGGVSGGNRPDSEDVDGDVEQVLQDREEIGADGKDQEGDVLPLTRGCCLIY